MADRILVEKIFRKEQFGALSDDAAGFLQAALDLETAFVRFDNEKGSNFADEFRRKVAEVNVPEMLRRAGQF